MIVLHDCDGNFGELVDREAFIARIRRAARSEWQGDSGQVGLEHRPPPRVVRPCESWMFFSLVHGDRYLVFSQQPAGRIYAADPAASPDIVRTCLIGGRQVQIADSELISSSEAADAARYFMTRDGLLTPVVHWRKEGQPYWPTFE